MTTEALETLAVEREDVLCEADEDLLVKMAKSGDVSAFEELSERHSRRVQKTVYRILGNWEDAEDVLQETLIRAFGHIAQFRGTCAFSTWLTRIAINSALMLLRRRRKQPETSVDGYAELLGDWRLMEFTDTAPDPERQCANREVEELLRFAILRLPRCYRAVFELYHSKDSSMIQVAETLGISVAAVKSRLYRARMTLRTSLPELGLSTKSALQ